MNIAILGCGQLGEAILAGLIASKTVPADSIVATARRPERVAELESAHGVSATLDNGPAIEQADVVLVCVKPQAAHSLLPSLAGSITDDKLIISTLAGVGLAQLESWLPAGAIVRAMPNMPCLIREGMSVLSRGRGAGDDQLQTARTVFEAVGRVMVLDEKHMDVVTGLSSSGPAFVYVVLEALADGGVMMGLPRAAALALAAQTMQGAARHVLASGEHPAALKDQVTTPAGCTIAGLLTLEDGRIRSTLARAIQEATQVAAGLGRAGD